MDKKNRKAKSWIALLFVGAILFIFRKSIVITAVKIALSFSLSGTYSSFTYEKIAWENNVIRIDDISFIQTGAEILIDQANIAFSGTPFSWKVHCTLFHPQVNVKQGGLSQSPPLHFLLSFRYMKMYWEVYDGIVQLDDNPPLYFSFLPDEEKHYLGNMALSYEPQSQSSPLFTASIEEKEDVLEIAYSLVEEDCSRLMPIIQILFPHLPKEWEQTKGKVKVCGALHMDRGFHLSHLSSQWQIDDLSLESKGREVQLCADHVTGSFTTEGLSSLDQLWQQGKGKMISERAELYIPSLLPYRFCLQEGDIILEPHQEPYVHLIGACEYKTLSLPFAIHAEGMLHSDASFLLGIETVIGEVPGMQLHASICRFDEEKYAIEINIKDLLFKHVAFFTAQLPFNWPETCWMKDASDGKWILLYENEAWQIDGSMTCGEEHVIAGALFDKRLELQEGWFETERMTERTYAPFLKFFDENISFTGEVQVKGNFEPNYIVFSMQGSNCTAHHPYGDLFFPSFGENGVEVMCDIKENVIKAEIPLQEAKWTCRYPEWNVDSLNAIVHVDGCTLHIPTFSAHYKGLALKGQIESFSIDRALRQMCFEKVKGHWELQNGTPFSLQIPHCNILYTEIPTASFHFILDQGQTRVLECAGSAQRKLTESWEIALDRHKTHFLRTPLNISGCQLSKEHRIALDMHPQLSSEELISHLAWLSNIGLLSIPLEALREIPCHANFQTIISSQDLRNEFCFKIDSKDIAYKGVKVGPIGVSGRYGSHSVEIDTCTGQDFAFKAHGILQGHSVYLSAIEGQYKDLFLKAQGNVDLITRAFTLSLDSIRGNTSDFTSVDALKGNFAAHGTLQGNLSTSLYCSGDAICTFDLIKPLGITAWNVKPFKISYASDTGLYIEELSVYLKSKKEGIVLGVLSLGQSRISSTFDVFEAQDCHCSVNSLILKECVAAHLLPELFTEIICPDKLEATGTIHLGREGVVCHASLKEGSYGIKDVGLALQKVSLQCLHGVFTLQAKAQVGEQPLWGALSLALTKNPQAILRITDDPKKEGIRMHFKVVGDEFHWEKIQGTCLGLDCTFAKNPKKSYTGATVLTGRIAFDGFRLNSLFGASNSHKFAQFKIGRGYSWQGDLILWQDRERNFQMTGEIIGEDWELLGYRFKKLRADIDAHPARIHLSRIHIEDEAGTIEIKKLEIEKKDRWELSIPIVSVREWHPSSMKRIDALSLPPKPFLIRNFTLSGIRAHLEDSASLQGRGKLTFTNQNKKESTLFDTPLEMIKNFGLDPHLLTPVQGEIDFDLKGDKVYLVGLKDVFSEAKRSEFYLPAGRELSYIDLDGKMHIDLKMRQDVTLKLTEPFVLTIRGTLDNPHYGLDLLP